MSNIEEHVMQASIPDDLNEHLRLLLREVQYAATTALCLPVQDMKHVASLELAHEIEKQLTFLSMTLARKGIYIEEEKIIDMIQLASKEKR